MNTSSTFLRRSALLAACTLLLGVAVPARAQSGTSVTDFTLKTAANAAVALKSYAGSKAVVVVFVNPACPFTRLYQGRLAALSGSYGSRGVQFLFINVPINLDASASADGPIDLPTLTDDSQQASGQLGVSKTTEAVVLVPEGGRFVVRYQGAIDDNPQVAGSVQQRYLQQALDNVLAGRPTGIEGKRAAGCLIKR
ncbi:redoxin domain-containing protein [uncultured Hymenobacter sp.]|uniref:redoxin domain-containing protein n=1 Tax=uncultured Hymenobacter sp. TaxID=170016 RepID=UPI0035CA82DD